MGELKKGKSELTTEMIYEKIEDVIRAGYSTDSLEVKEEWEKLFGKDHEPSVEEFIKTIVQNIK